MKKKKSAPLKRYPKLADYLERAEPKKLCPARIKISTLKRLKKTAAGLDIQIAQAVEIALVMFCDEAKLS